VGKQEGRLWRFRPRKTSIGQILAANGCDDAELVSFIEALVRTDPDARLDATEALRHPFITSCPVECSPYALGEDDTKGEAGLRLLMKYASLNDARVQDGRAKNPVADALLQVRPRAPPGAEQPYALIHTHCHTPTQTPNPRQPSHSRLMHTQFHTYTLSSPLPTSRATLTPLPPFPLQEEANPGPATPTAFREQCYLNRERMEKKRARKSGSSRLAGADMPNLDHMVITNPSSS
jgi:serine/threonine protein kinase